jgi:tetratricopeptide (TPR) repeat protein
MKEANKLFLQKDYNAAVEKYRQVSELSPFNSKCHYNLGLCYEPINNPKLAIAAYQKALLIKSNFTEAQTALAKSGGKSRWIRISKMPV